MIHLVKARRRLLLTAGVLLVAGLSGARGLFADDNKPTTAMIVTGISMPSKESNLAFAAPGIVVDILVKEGDQIKAGQILAKQDDGQDQQDLEKLKVDAASTFEIEYDKADLAVKQTQSDRKKEMVRNNVASVQELEEAELQVALDRAKIDVSELQHQEKGFDAVKQGIKVDRLQLRSLFDGKVQQINIHQGEMAEPDPGNHQGAIVVVNNNPLWVELHLPTFQSQQLRVDQVMQVRYPGDKDWQSAKVTFISPKADAGSDTQRVKLELPNPTGRDSGFQMQVKLPENMVAAASTDTASNP